MRENERTLKMKQEFVSRRDEGQSINQIADRFGLSPSTVYKKIDQIAQDSGRTRESLLERVHRPHLTHDRLYEPLQGVDVGEYRRKIGELKTSCNELRELMDSYIAREEAIQNGGNDI